MSYWMLQVCLILIVSILLGRVAERLGQSRVIGEITAGLLLGPAVLGAVLPNFSSFLFPPESLINLKVLAELGLVLLMFEIAWHVPSPRADQPPVAKLIPIIIAVFGMLSSFLIGCLLAVLSKKDMAPDKAFLPYVLFCGLALSVTALPVLVRIIADAKNISVTSASYALSSAIYTDVFAWLGVSLLVAFHSMGANDVLGSLVKTLSLIGFFLFSFYVMRPLLAGSKFMAESGSHVQLSIAFCYCLVSSEVTARLGFHEAIGAVVAAYVFCKVPGLERNWGNVVSRFSGTFLTPLFFAYSGLQASFGSFSESIVWGWLVLFVLGTLLGKIGGAYLGGRLCGLTSTTALEIGVLMNTKGLVELVVLSIGLELNILSETTYSVLLILALFSTIMTMPLLTLWMQRSYKAGATSITNSGEPKI